MSIHIFYELLVLEGARSNLYAMAAVKTPDGLLRNDENIDKYRIFLNF